VKRLSPFDVQRKLKLAVTVNKNKSSVSDFGSSMQQENSKIEINLACFLSRFGFCSGM
jgi:hypothetical protein